MQALNLLVLYVTDLDAAVRFYSTCGLTFHPEQHGSGPAHYSAVMRGGAGPLVLELYPRGTGPATRTRLGFAVDDAAGAAADLHAAGYRNISEPLDLDYGRVRVARDPDGNAVELIEAPPPQPDARRG